MLFLKVIRRILNHPLNSRNRLGAFFRFVKWQIGNRLVPFPVIYPFTNKCKLIVKRGLTGATGNLYCGLDELNDMGFLLHFLRPEDCFIDVGANIGSYTILAAGHIGSDVVSVEPSPNTFKLLLDNIKINNLEMKVRAVNSALGSETGVLRFTKNYDTVNHIALPDEKDSEEVNVEILDNVVLNRNPILIKIDVEGYEREVLNGAKNTLKLSSLKAIIVELVNHGNRYGFTNDDVHKRLMEHDFIPYTYNPLKRSLEKKSEFDTQNTIYIRDVDYINSRIKSATLININGFQF